MFTRKDRKIANQKVMIENRDKFIEQQEKSILCLRAIIESMAEDLEAVREIAFKTAKKRTSRPSKSN